MTLVVAVGMLKGGAGKTTTAVALAEAASLGGGPVTLIDTDPMGAAVRWSVLAAEADTPLRSTVVGMPTEDLERRIGQATHGAAVVVVDSPPPGNLKLSRAAIQVADVVVMPVQPNAGELDRIPATRAIAAERGIPSFAVLSMVKTGLADRTAAVTALIAWGVPVLATEMRDTVNISRQYGQAPHGELARYGIDLMGELLDKMEGARHG